VGTLAIVIIISVTMAILSTVTFTETDPVNYTKNTYDKVNQSVFEGTIDIPSIMDLVNTEDWKVFSIRQDGITYYDGERLHNIDISEDQKEKLFSSRPYLIHSTATHCDKIDLNLTPFVHTLHLVTKEMIEASSHCLFIQRINTRASSRDFKKRVIERNISEIRGDMVKSLPIAKKIVAEHYKTTR
jgi:hypothetical protein